jgi:hypothetical protein
MRKRVIVIVVVIVVVATLVVGGLLLRDDTSGETYTVALPSGSASIEKLPSGWRLELDVPDLPRLDDGEYYQAWLANDEGTLVPIGTFNEGDDLVLWAGVSPADYPVLSVTRERADNDQESSGDRVLSGTFEEDD